MIKTIITIDFDIIMAPCIERYNNIIPKLSWTDIKTIPYLNDLYYNKDFYSKIKDYIKQYSSDNKVFIKEHDGIIPYIDKECYLINVDHHHDCGYQKNEMQLNCSNWLKYVYDKQLIKDNPIWYCDDNSIHTNTPDWLIVKSFEREELPFGDLLVIANSAPWIPPEYQPLFEELKNL